MPSINLYLFLQNISVCTKKDTSYHPQSVGLRFLMIGCIIGLAGYLLVVKSVNKIT